MITSPDLTAAEQLLDRSSAHGKEALRTNTSRSGPFCLRSAEIFTVTCTVRRYRLRAIGRERSRMMRSAELTPTTVRVAQRCGPEHNPRRRIFRKVCGSRIHRISYGFSRTYHNAIRGLEPEARHAFARRPGSQRAHRQPR